MVHHRAGLGLQFGLYCAVAGPLSARASGRAVRPSSRTAGAKAHATAGSSDPGLDPARTQRWFHSLESRKLARALGVNHMMVARVWRRAGLKPQRLERYRASDDPDFELKAADVIGLYVSSPAARGGILCRREDRDSGARSPRPGAAALAWAGRAPRL
jgi:hypothetical protein